MICIIYNANATFNISTLRKPEYRSPDPLNYILRQSRHDTCFWHHNVSLDRASLLLVLRDIKTNEDR